MFTIYKHTNKTTNKCYIGWTSKSVEQRWRKHVTNAKSGSSYHFHRAIVKYGENDWETCTLETLETQIDALLAEVKWIANHHSNDPNHGYNSSTGGEAAVPNEIARQHLSEAQRKRFTNPNERLKTSLGAKKRPSISDETRERLRQSKLGCNNPQFGKSGPSAARYQKSHSDETKLKIAQKKKGQRLSEEAKKKCSEASKKRWELQRKKDQHE